MKRNKIRKMQEELYDKVTKDNLLNEDIQELSKKIDNEIVDFYKNGEDATGKRPSVVSEDITKKRGQKVQ